MIKKFIALYFVCYLLLSSFIPIGMIYAQPDQKLTLAVLDLEAKGVSQVEAEVISEKFRSYLAQEFLSARYQRQKDKTQYTVIERDQMEKLLDEQGVQISGCVDEACAVELGKILGAYQVVLGTIGLVGETFSVTVRFIDVETAEVVGKPADRQYKGSIDDVISTVIPEVADELIYGAKKSRIFYYILGGIVVAAGAGAAVAMGGKDGGGGDNLPHPPARP